MAQVAARVVEQEASVHAGPQMVAQEGMQVVGLVEL